MKLKSIFFLSVCPENIYLLYLLLIGHRFRVLALSKILFLMYTVQCTVMYIAMCIYSVNVDVSIPEILQY